MMIGQFLKQPVDVVDYDITYAEWLIPGDKVTSTDVVVEPDGLRIESVFVNNPIVKIWTAGGAHGQTYKVTVTTNTTGGRVRQDEFKIKVKDF